MSEERFGIVYSDGSISVLRSSKNTPAAAFHELGSGARHGDYVVRLKIEILEQLTEPMVAPRLCPTCGHPHPPERGE